LGRVVALQMAYIEQVHGGHHAAQLLQAEASGAAAAHFGEGEAVVELTPRPDVGQAVDVGGPLGGQDHVVVHRPPVVAVEGGEVAAVLGHEVERRDAVPADGG